jgi:hypothetical protein
MTDRFSRPYQHRPQKGQFQYVCWITIDNNIKHTKWHVMDVEIAAMHSGRGAKLIQRVLVVVYTHICVVYVHVRKPGDGTLVTRFSLWTVIHILLNNRELYTLTTLFYSESVAQEPEGSSPFSWQLANVPYPEPVESNPHPQPISLRSILISSSHLHLGLPSCLFPSGFPTKSCALSFLSHACHMSCPPHSPWFDLPNDIWGWVQIMKLLLYSTGYITSWKWRLNSSERQTNRRLTYKI